MPDDRPPPTMRGRRILVVEDEYIVAEDLRRELESQGAEVLGPVPTVERALALLASDTAVDGAILDINLRGEVVFPVAEVLRSRGIPFLFATGYDTHSLPQSYAQAPCCEKPFDAGRCARTLFG